MRGDPRPPSKVFSSELLLYVLLESAVRLFNGLFKSHPPYYILLYEVAIKGWLGSYLIIVVSNHNFDIATELVAK